MLSYPTGATPHRFLCGVVPVGQMGVERIWAFHTGTSYTNQTTYLSIVLDKIFIQHTSIFWVVVANALKQISYFLFPIFTSLYDQTKPSNPQTLKLLPLTDWGTNASCSSCSFKIDISQTSFIHLHNVQEAAVSGQLPLLMQNQVYIGIRTVPAKLTQLRLEM